MVLKFYNFAKQTNSTKKMTSTEESSLALVLNGNFEVESSLQKPTVIISNTNALALNSKNYFSITFDNAPTTRYYFIREVVALPNGRVRVEGIEDVFATFSSNMANAKLHIVGTDNRSLINKNLYAPVIQLPTSKEHYDSVYKKHYSIATNIFSNDNGMFIVGIAMNELDRTTMQPVVSRPHATVVTSGIGYYLFSYAGFQAIMGNLQKWQSQNSDYNIKDKVVNIKYLPIGMNWINHDTSIADDLRFDLGIINGNQEYVDVQQVVNGYPVYKVPTPNSANQMSKGNIKFTQSLPSITWNDLVIDLPSDMVPIYPSYGMEPYVNMQVFMGPFGIIDVSAHDWVSQNAEYSSNANDVSQEYEVSIDLITGAAKLRLLVITWGGTPRINLAEDILAEKNIQLCPSIPFYGLDSLSLTSLTMLQDKAKLGVITSAASIIGGGVMGDARGIGGGVLGLMGTQMMYQDAVNKELTQSGYAIGSSSGSFLDFDSITGKFEVLVSKAKLDRVFYYATDFIKECSTIETMSNIPSGSFIICDQVELVSTSGMNYEEQAKVKDLLRSGVFVE